MEKRIMVKPSLSALMEKENVNRYALVIATAQCARQITDDYMLRRQYVDNITKNKNESGKSVSQDDSAGKNLDNIINEKYRDEKAVKNAIDELYSGEYRIIQSTLPAGMGNGEATAAAEEEEIVAAEAAE